MTKLLQRGLALETFLIDHADEDVARALDAFAKACSTIACELRRGPLGPSLESESISLGPDGDLQKPLDLIADALILKALANAGVVACVSEEMREPAWLGDLGGDFPGALAGRRQGRLIAAIDPLDGSSNIDANVTLGSILSLMEAPAPPDASAFLQAGRRQKAAAFALYGPHTSFIFTLGDGVHVATLDFSARLFRMSQFRVRIPEGANEFAINAANARHWPAPVKAYVADCLAGREGPRGKDFNMRWVATAAADAYRILMRGGVYLYPGDARAGYADGRLHRLYETNPLAFIVEQAGGEASDGVARILDAVPASIHERTPFIFGSGDKVEGVKSYFAEGAFPATRAPLFNQRGLLRP